MSRKKHIRKVALTTMAASAAVVSIAPVASAAETKEFKDVPKGSSHYDGVQWAVAEGIVKGYEDGTFGVGKNLTRSHAAVMFVKARGLKELPASEVTQYFNDVNEKTPYAGYIAAAGKAGIFKGDAKKNFNINNPLTREQMATTLVQAFGLKSDGKHVDVNLKNVAPSHQANVQIIADLGITNQLKDFRPAQAVQRGQFATFLKLTNDVINAPAAAPAVESVKAINAKTAVVTFTQPVKKSTVVDGSGKLVAANITFRSLETPAKTFTGASADAELSEDGKTLTITPQTNEVFEGRYHVVVDNVETTKSEKLPKYDEVVNLGKDTTAPAVASVEKINASTSKVTFTEAIANLSTASEVTYSYKLVDGTVVPSADVTVTPATDGKSITVSASAAKYAGKTITATILGAKDYAGNLISPNPSTFNFQVGDKDGVAPTVVSTKAISPTKVEVNFSEEVQGFATTVAADADSRVKLTGAANKISATVKAKAITQDKTDKKKYIVELDGSALDGTTKSAVADLKINKSITLAATGTSVITDLSGEELKTDYTSIVTVKEDTVAPKLVSTKVVAEAGTQWLVIDFDKELNATPATAVAPVAASASSYKDFVTVSGKNMTLGSAAALTNDNKGIKVKLSNDSTAANLAQFDGAALVDGTKYTFDVKATDVSGNTSDATKVEFTYNGKADSSKPALVSTTPITGNGQDTITVEFDKELDGASATNAANYKIAGVPVEKAVLSPVSNGTQKVTLTLGQNSQSGDRSISISGVKSKAGVAMDTHNGTVTLKENVKPTVTAAKVTATNKVELTFSENVVLTGTANFDVFIGDATTAVTGVTSVAETTTDNKTVITLTTALTDEDLAKTITVKPSSSVDVKDVAGNVLDFKSIVVTK